MRLDVVRVDKGFMFFGCALARSRHFLGENKLGNIRRKQIFSSFTVLKNTVFIVVNRKVIKPLAKLEEAYFASHPVSENGAVPVDIPRVYPYIPAERNLGKGYRFHTRKHSTDLVPVSSQKKAVARANFAIGNVIQTGGATTKIKGELKPVKGFCQALKGCHVALI
jgi:hypothetical protein